MSLKEDHIKILNKKHDLCNLQPVFVPFRTNSGGRMPVVFGRSRQVNAGGLELRELDCPGTHRLFVYNSITKQITYRKLNEALPAGISLMTSQAISGKNLTTTLTGTGGKTCL